VCMSDAVARSCVSIRRSSGGLRPKAEAGLRTGRRQVAKRAAAKPPFGLIVRRGAARSVHGPLRPAVFDSGVPRDFCAVDRPSELSLPPGTTAGQSSAWPPAAIYSAVATPLTVNACVHTLAASTVVGDSKWSSSRGPANNVSRPRPAWDGRGSLQILWRESAVLLPGWVLPQD
jgi:hypothetical protein